MEVYRCQPTPRFLILPAYLDQRSNVLVLDRSLTTDFVKSTPIRTVSHALILKVALATLVANRAVERVVGEEEFHDTLTGLVNEGRIGLDSHTGLNGPSAGSDWLWGSLDFDQTHTTVSGNHELLVVAVSGNRCTGLFAGLNKSRTSCGTRQYMSRGIFAKTRSIIRAVRELCAALVSHSPSILTGLSSTKISTSAFRGCVVAKVRAALDLVRGCGRRHARMSCLDNMADDCEEKEEVERSGKGVWWRQH